MSENDEHQDTSNIEKSVGGRPRSRLSDQPTRKTVCHILQPKIDELVAFADEQGVSIEQLLEMLKSHTGNKHVKRSRTENVIPTDDAAAFFFLQDFSTRSWTELRLFFKKYDIILPTRNAIDEEKKKFHPPITVEEIKSSVQYGELIQNTVESFLKESNYDVDLEDKLQLKSKSGIDGSGNHKARYQLVDIQKSREENPHLDPYEHKNFILTCFCPLQLSVAKPDGTTHIILCNKSPNSISFTRPISLIRASESRQVIETEFSRLFSTMMDNDTMNLKVSPTQVCPIVIDNSMSMVDGKMVSLLQGDSGSPCHYCGNSVAEINDMVNTSSEDSKSPKLLNHVRGSGQP